MKILIILRETIGSKGGARKIHPIGEFCVLFYLTIIKRGVQFGFL